MVRTPPLLAHLTHCRRRAARATQIYSIDDAGPAPWFMARLQFTSLSEHQKNLSLLPSTNSARETGGDRKLIGLGDADGNAWLERFRY